MLTLFKANGLKEVVQAAVEADMACETGLTAGQGACILEQIAATDVKEGEAVFLDVFCEDIWAEDRNGMFNLNITIHTFAVETGDLVEAGDPV